MVWRRLQYFTIEYLSCGKESPDFTPAQVVVSYGEEMTTEYYFAFYLYTWECHERIFVYYFWNILFTNAIVNFHFGLDDMIDGMIQCDLLKWEDFVGVGLSDRIMSKASIYHDCWWMDYF